jgi:hypothetical protein
MSGSVILWKIKNYVKSVRGMTVLAAVGAVGFGALLISLDDGPKSAPAENNRLAAEESSVSTRNDSLPEDDLAENKAENEDEQRGPSSQTENLVYDLPSPDNPRAHRRYQLRVKLQRYEQKLARMRERLRVREAQAERIRSELRALD